MSPLFLIVVLLMFMPAVILHEVAHGWVAYKLGDPTAKMMGRLTLNPIKHIDLIGTILLPLALVFISILTRSQLFIFGMAKPVPVNPSNLPDPKRDMIWVGLAGPGVNILLALILSFVLKMNLSSMVAEFIKTAIMINLLLAVFNLIPIPPLDGSRVVTGLLPDNLAYAYARLERHGILIIFALLYLGVLRQVVFPIVTTLGAILGVI